LEGATKEFAGERMAHPECGLALLGQARIAVDNAEYQPAATLLKELWRRDHGFVESNAALLVDGMPGDRAAAVADNFSQAAAQIPADLRDALLAAFNGGGQGSDAPAGRRESGALSTKESAFAPRRTAKEYYATGEFEQCAHQFDLAVAAGRADELRLLAACAYLTGDNKRASRAAAALEALQPHSPEALYWSIQANERLALQSLARFQQLESNSARSHVLLGDIFDQLERYDDALAEYGKALAIDPDDPAAMLGLATAYLSNNKMEKAMETARSALVRSPDDPELNLVMAEAMVGRNQFAEAEPFLIKSLNAKPQVLGHVHALLGKVYAETGRTQDAIDQLKLGASSDENGSIHYLLARLYRQSGNLKDASIAIEQVKTIKEQRRERGVKLVEDPELSALESPHGEASTP